jgi:hypothetical protein
MASPVLRGINMNIDKAAELLSGFEASERQRPGHAVFAEDI